MVHGEEIRKTRRWEEEEGVEVGGGGEGGAVGCLGSRHKVEIFCSHHKQKEVV